MQTQDTKIGLFKMTVWYFWRPKSKRKYIFIKNVIKKCSQFYQNWSKDIIVISTTVALANAFMMIL